MEVVLEFLRQFRFSFILIFLARYFYLLILSFFSIIIYLLLIFGLLPVNLFLLDTFLQMEVDIRLFHLGLSFTDEEAQFIVKLVNQFEDIKKLRTLGLVRT